jgi:chromosome segregation ATPase
MSLEDLEKMLAEQESFLTSEFGKIREDLKEMQESFDTLEKEIEEEEAFVLEMEATLHRESEVLENLKSQEVIDELVKKEGSVQKALARIDKEIGRITGFTSKISDRWDGNSDIESLKTLVEEFEVLKKRFNQVDKKRDLLITKADS